ncbi:hypothetical protein [Nostoc sp.]|uniref:hypothetical protein n=1 Tax=Nostoc sp. TaxID=1180 RepID=UPI002FFC5C6D
MMSNNSYNQIIATSSNELAKNRLEIAAVRLELKPDISVEDLSLFKFLWDSVIDSSFKKLNDSDLREWNQIAKSNNMPLSFDESFKIQLGEISNIKS